MIIHVKVKPNSSKIDIQSFGENQYLVYLKESPENNKANLELTKVLAKHFKIPPKDIKLKFGKKNSHKILEII